MSLLNLAARVAVFDQHNAARKTQKRSRPKKDDADCVIPPLETDLMKEAQHFSRLGRAGTEDFAPELAIRISNWKYEPK